MKQIIVSYKKFHFVLNFPDTFCIHFNNITEQEDYHSNVFKEKRLFILKFSQALNFSKLFKKTYLASSYNRSMLCHSA